jgi:hypothetical protein
LYTGELPARGIFTERQAWAIMALGVVASMLWVWLVAVGVAGAVAVLAPWLARGPRRIRRAGP